MTRFNLTLLLLFVHLSVFSLPNLKVFKSVDSDTNAVGKEKKSIRLPKVNTPKPSFSGNLNYNFNFFQTNLDTLVSYQLNTPRHFISGEVKTDVQNVPIIGKFVYDPSLPQQDQFKFNFSFDHEKFNSDLGKKYQDKKKNYASYKDSLLQSNMELALQKQLTEIKLNKLKKPQPQLDYTKHLAPLNSLPDTSLISFDIPDTTLIPFDSLAIKDTSKIKLDTTLPYDPSQEIKMDTSFSYNPAKYQDSIMGKNDSIQKEILKLEQQIENYDKRIQQITNLVSNDSLLQQKSLKFDMDKSIGLDSVSTDQYLSPLEKTLSSIKSFQIGTVSPNFSKLSTYRATLTGIDFSFNPTKQVSLHVFGGWQPHVSYAQNQTAIKSGGLKVSSDIFSVVEFSTSIVYNYRKEQFYNESILPEINNPIVGIGFKSISLKNIELGTEFNYAENLHQPTPFVFTTDKLGFSSYVKFHLPQTKSRLFLEMDYVPKNFQNYLTPYQIPSNTTYKTTFSQQLFKSKISSRIAVTHRDIQSENDLVTQNTFTSINVDLRTRWVKHPNLFATISSNKNKYQTSNTENLGTSTLLSTFGISLLRRIKKTKLYGEFSFQNATTNSRNSINQSQKYRFVFRVKNKKLNYDLNTLYSESYYISKEIGNQLLFNLKKGFKLGGVSRWTQIHDLHKLSNGIKFSTSYKKFSLRSEYILTTTNKQSNFSQIVNAQISYRF